MNDPTDGPQGAPVAVFIEGILDGRVADGARLSEATRNLGTTGAGPFKLEVQGGRFTLLPVETMVAGASFDAAAQGRFLSALHDVLAAAVPGSVEANLRCRLVYADEVAETLFVVRGEQIEPLTRRRPATAADRGNVPAGQDATTLPFGLRRKEILWLAPVLLLLGVFFLWQGGWIDRVLTARAEDLARDTGAFGATLAFDVERSWGNYKVVLRRGADYPTTPSAIEAAKAAAKDDLVRTTAIGLVGDGRELFVQLLADDGKVLAETTADLRPLLASDTARVEATLPGQMGAATFRLSVTKAPRPQ
ncbi:MAG: hypothetical protein JNK15_16240 [Planctomycetes bacterium]|nr:hypothetical protein [Planctomycetota bacterium]